jgi:hypothetical protein
MTQDNVIDLKKPEAFVVEPAIDVHALTLMVS